MQAPRRRCSIAPTHSWPRYEMEVSGQRHAPAVIYPRERTPGNHWIRGWVGHRASQRYQQLHITTHRLWCCYCCDQYSVVGVFLYVTITLHNMFSCGGCSCEVRRFQAMVKRQGNMSHLWLFIFRHTQYSPGQCNLETLFKVKQNTWEHSTYNSSDQSAHYCWWHPQAHNEYSQQSRVFATQFINLPSRFWLAEVAQYTKYLFNISWKRHVTRIYCAIKLNVYEGVRNLNGSSRVTRGNKYGNRHMQW
jgi:hypothetical protein